MAQYAECDATHIVTGSMQHAQIPGSFNYFSAAVTADKNMIVGMTFVCPCGCGRIQSIRFSGHGAKDKRPAWDWDGNRDKPTLHPSIRTPGDTKDDDHWHGYLTMGRWVSV